MRRAAGISGQIPRHGRQVPDTWVVVTRGPEGANVEHHVWVSPQNAVINGAGPATGVAKIGNTQVHVESEWTFGHPLFVGDVDGAPITVQIDRRGTGYRLFHSGSQIDVSVYTQRQAELARLMPHKPPPDLSKYLLSPMPGLLVSLAVKEGQEVKSGEALAVVEAMKMENVLKAERDGVVKKIHEKAGASLAVDQMILEFA
jgi:propionyl-CoA carboxylase alpha chain